MAALLANVLYWGLSGLAGVQRAAVLAATFGMGTRLVSGGASRPFFVFLRLCCGYWDARVAMCWQQGNWGEGGPEQ